MLGKIDERLAAYALNMWTVSVAQIIDYNDVNIMEQEYDMIMNNLNLEHMPKNEALLDVIKEIMDEITNMRMDDGDRKIIEQEYQHHIKNAIWSAVPSVGTIFATSDIFAMGLTLATQVGIGYMNYRRNKADYQLGNDKSKWEIQKNRMRHLNGLQKQLFETAWRMSDEYGFKEDLRLTQKQITDYNQALMENNSIRRYKALDAMKQYFEAYPSFWYQMGSTANSIYRGETDADIVRMYKKRAIECFEKYKDIYNSGEFQLLRTDIITSSWALEYLELMDYSVDSSFKDAVELIEIAEKNAGNALDVLELCAFSYLRLKDYINAIRLFEILVNKGYNVTVNTQILSGLYIIQMRNSDKDIALEAKVGYKQLNLVVGEANKKFILDVPDDIVDLDLWRPCWNKADSFEEMIAKKDSASRQKAIDLVKRKSDARAYYQMPICVVYGQNLEDIAEYLMGIINDIRIKLDQSLPSPIQISIKEYKKNRIEYDNSGRRIIFIGESDETKKFSRVVNKKWDYNEFGIKYVSHGNKVVFIVDSIKNKEINEFIDLARKMSEKHDIRIPDGVNSVEFSLIKEVLKGQFDDPNDRVAAILATITASPLLAAGQVIELILNGVQCVWNATSRKKMEFLQYCICIYLFLDEQNALID